MPNGGHSRWVKWLTLNVWGNPRVSNVKQLSCAHQSHWVFVFMPMYQWSFCVWLYLPGCGPHRLACAFLMAWVLVHKVCHACLFAISWNFFSLPSSSDLPPFLVLELWTPQAEMRSCASLWEEWDDVPWKQLLAYWSNKPRKNSSKILRVWMINIAQPCLCLRAT